MKYREALAERLETLGIDDSTVLDPGATLRPTPSLADPYQETAPGPSANVDIGELPVISVELRGTLPGPAALPAAEASTDRDLELLATLGEGGMGRVFLARQRSLDRDVAIKTTKDHASPGARRALVEEGVVTGHLEHPGIVPVHALGTDSSGRPVLVMKRVEGTEWSHLLADPAHPFWEDRGGDANDRLPGHVEILASVCSAVHFAHSRGVVHRDIKPPNVLIGRFGDVYLADWGVALRLDAGDTREGMRGTPLYAAPEMVLGTDIDARTDVYLLGATLHEILTGAPPHKGGTLIEVLKEAVRGDALEYPGSAPGELVALARRAMASDPDARPQDAAEFRRELLAYLGHRSSSTIARSAIERLQALETLLESGAEESLAEIDRLVAETQFGLAQALEQWPDNTVAKGGQQQLEQILSARRARAAELSRMARELDPTIAARPRAVVSVVTALVGIALSVVAVVQYEQGRSFSPLDLFYQSLLPTGVLLLALPVIARHIARTTLNRRTMTMAAVAIFGITLSRALAIVRGENVAQMLTQDSLIAAVAALVSAPGTFRWAVPVGLAMLASAIVCALVPHAALLAFALGSGAALVIVAAANFRKPS